MRFITNLVLLVLLAACAVENNPSVTPPPPTSTTTTTSPDPTSTTSPATTTTTVAADACPEGDVMLADGRLLEFDRATSDATRISGITWRVQSGCHVVTIAFATESGAPATTPPSIDARLIRAAGVLRIDTEATESVVVDQLVEEGSLQRLYVPEGEEGRRFIDLVLSEPTVARARVLTAPARLELELQPGGSETGSPLMTPQVVVVEPGSAAVAESVLDVSGYTTGDIESLDLVVLDGEQQAASATVELEPSPGLWRTFGEVLQVGESYETLRITTPDGSVIAAIPLGE